MLEPVRIASMSEILPGERYILVMYGKENGSVRHSRGHTIKIAKGCPGYSKEFELQNTLLQAKALARVEGIIKVYFMEERST